MNDKFRCEICDKEVNIQFQSDKQLERNPNLIFCKFCEEHLKDSKEKFI